MQRDLAKLQSDFWDNAAETKQFSDPFYIERIEQYLTKDSLVIEYGCGYGRLLNILHQNSYQNTIGYDFSSCMINKGKRTFPNLQLELIQHANLPLKEKSVDAAIISTVLCCVPDTQAEKQIIDELERVLKPGAVLYFTDFLLTDTEYMQQKYLKFLPMYNCFGIYQTSEGAVVRHFSKDHINHLMSGFQPVWYLEREYVTMNNNTVNTFHAVYQKPW